MLTRTCLYCRKGFSTGNRGQKTCHQFVCLDKHVKFLLQQRKELGEQRRAKFRGKQPELVMRGQSQPGSRISARPAKNCIHCGGIFHPLRDVQRVCYDFACKRVQKRATARQGLLRKKKHGVLAKRK